MVFAVFFTLPNAGLEGKKRKAKIDAVFLSTEGEQSHEVRKESGIPPDKLRADRMRVIRSRCRLYPGDTERMEPLHAELDRH